MNKKKIVIGQVKMKIKKTQKKIKRKKVKNNKIKAITKINKIIKINHQMFKLQLLRLIMA
jgi:hypothetical protein